MTAGVWPSDPGRLSGPADEPHRRGRRLGDLCRCHASDVARLAHLPPDVYVHIRTGPDSTSSERAPFLALAPQLLGQGLPRSRLSATSPRCGPGSGASTEGASEPVTGARDARGRSHDARLRLLRARLRPGPLQPPV